MKQAVFITGFNNWGKTTIIQELFDRNNFSQGQPCQIEGVNAVFTVCSQSNDDFRGQRWIGHIQEGLKSNLNLFTALCPSMEESNSFVDLLSNPLFTSYKRLHIFLLKYKWEHHAELIIPKIKAAGRNIPNVNFITIDADQSQRNNNTRERAKIEQIRQKLSQIFPF